MYNDGNHRVTLSLRVMDITYSDYGNYTCFAKNLLGEDQEVMLLYGKAFLSNSVTGPCSWPLNSPH